MKRELVGHIFMPTREISGQTKLDVGDPHWLVVTPDGKTVYICLAHFKEVIAIDVATMKEVAQIPVGDGAKMIAAK